MKKIAVLFLVAGSTLLTSQAIKADIIANWTFQTSASTNNIIGAGLSPSSTQSGVLADIGSGTASAFHATATTAWTSPAGNGSTNSWSANNWSLNDYYLFQVSTIGYSSLGVSFDQVGSATGPKNFGFQYSTDGVIFTPYGIYSVTSAPAWNVNTAGSALESFSFDLSSILALNNSSADYFRVVDLSSTTGGAINLGNVGTGGTGRIDNFLVIGAVPEPSSLALAALGGIGCLFAYRRKR